MKVSVIIPTMPDRSAMLKDAVHSVRQQQEWRDSEIVIAAEQAAEPPDIAGVHCIFAANQSAKINAGVQAATGDALAILHDDDLWHPAFLYEATKALQFADFVSSTALMTDEDDDIIGIQDCPVPSGWVFRRTAFVAVGDWNEDCQFHPDSEWLGRMGERAMIRRAHLMDAFAPSPRIRIGGEYRYNGLAQRPGMLALLQQARPTPNLIRHGHASPLVIHRQHGRGIMQRINEPERWAQSQWEYQRLTEKFGRIPW